MSKLSNAIRKNLPELISFLSESEDQLKELEIEGTPAEDILSSMLSSAIAMDNLYGDKGNRIELILNKFTLTEKILGTEDLERAIRWNTSYKRDGEGILTLLEFATKHQLVLKWPKLLSTAIEMDNALCSKTNSSTKAILDFLKEAGIVEKTISKQHKDAAINNPIVLGWLNNLSKAEAEPVAEKLSFFKGPTFNANTESERPELRVVSTAFVSN